jgi:hypothetical protein
LNIPALPKIDRASSNCFAFGVLLFINASISSTISLFQGLGVTTHFLSTLA